jgi:hypothetical protein
MIYRQAVRNIVWHSFYYYYYLLFNICLGVVAKEGVVLAEGPLQKHSPSKVLVKRWQTRYFVLSSSSPSATTLAYYKRKGGSNTPPPFFFLPSSPHQWRDTLDLAGSWRCECCAFCVP